MSELRKRSRARTARLVLAAFAVTSAGCDLGTTNVPQTTPSIVVHAVLNPSASVQVMLLERTLTGALTIPDTTYDPNNPIATAGGIPVPGARAELVDSAGNIVTAAEPPGDSTGIGSGVYQFLIPGSQLHLGGRYQLHVRTRDGDELTAFTRVPRPEIASSGGLSRAFNRDHDTLVVAWKPVPFARAYALRIESPHGPFFLFTDSTALRLAGGLRNLFSAELSRLFVPGFRQEIRVMAVDSNFYDYYRTNNDPFTGAGIISRVTGGLGLFGAVVTLNSGTLTVTADQTEPVEGRYRLTPFSQAQTTRATTINLYIESKSTRPDVPDALSGRYTSPIRNDGIIGELSGTTISFALLADQLVGDTVDVFTGEVKGTTITGSYRKQGTTAVFVKQ